MPTRVAQVTHYSVCGSPSFGLLYGGDSRVGKLGRRVLWASSQLPSAVVFEVVLCDCWARKHLLALGMSALG